MSREMEVLGFLGAQNSSPFLEPKYVGKHKRERKRKPNTLEKLAHHLKRLAHSLSRLTYHLKKAQANQENIYNPPAHGWRQKQRQKPKLSIGVRLQHMSKDKSNASH